MADPKRVDSGGGLAGVADLLKLFGGTQQSTQNTANIGALQGVLGQLQGVDPTAQLASVMQTLAGQTPGLQSRYANAVGARSGNNGALQGGLERLLSDATVKAQQNIATQQLQNLATQGQVAGSIAQATGGQKTSGGTNMAKAATGLGALQAVGSVMNSDLFKKGKGAVTGLLSGFGGGDNPALTSASSVPELSSLFDFSVPDLGGGGITDFAGSFGAGDVGSSLGDVSDFYGSSGGDSGAGLWDSVTDFFGFADGGLVGRDGSRTDNRQVRIRKYDEAEEAATSSAQAASQPKKEEDDEDLAAMRRANAKRNPKTGRPLDDYDRKSKMVDQKMGIRFADGGPVSVRSGGGRRSSAPTYDPVQVIASLAQQGRGVLNPQQMLGGMGAAGSDPQLGDATGSDPSPVSLGSGVLGQAVAQNQQDVVSAFAQAMLGQMGVPGLGKSPMGLAQTMLGAGMQEQGMLNAINSAEDPIAALAIANSWLPAEAAMGLGSNSLASAANAVSTATGMDPMDALMSVTDSFGTGMGSQGGGMGIGTNSDPAGGFFGTDAGGTGATSDDGGLGATAGSGNSGGDDGAGSSGGEGSSGDGSGSSGDGYRNGGAIDGPGSGTSDSIHAMVSDGEYIIPADVVEKMGVEFFDHLRDSFHSYNQPGA